MQVCYCKPIHVHLGIFAATARRPRATSVPMSCHRSLCFKVISAARLTAWLRPNAVIRSQVEPEVLRLL